MGLRFDKVTAKVWGLGFLEHGVVVVVAAAAAVNVLNLLEYSDGFFNDLNSLSSTLVRTQFLSAAPVSDAGIVERQTVQRMS